MSDYLSDRLHLLAKGFEDGEIVIANQDNGWLVSTFKTCEVSAEEHENLVAAMVERWNAVDDVFRRLAAKRERWGGLSLDEAAIIEALSPLVGVRT